MWFGRKVFVDMKKSIVNVSSYSRRDVMALGKMSLNIAGAAENYANYLHSLLYKILTKVCMDKFIWKLFYIHIFWFIKCNVIFFFFFFTVFDFSYNVFDVLYW